MNKALILYDEEQAGFLEETDNGYCFSYCQSYLEKNDARPISLTLPLRKESYHSQVLFPFFDGLIPEGWLLEIGTNYWKINPQDRFQLLLHLCRETLGAVTVHPFNEEENDA